MITLTIQWGQESTDRNQCDAEAFMMVAAGRRSHAYYVVLTCPFVKTPAAGENLESESWTEIVMLQIGKEYDQIHTQGGEGDSSCKVDKSIL
jgi:hypothetical protein